MKDKDSAIVYTVHTVFPGEDRTESAEFELLPTNEQGQAVCSLFLEFLADRPPEFRDRLSFLKHGDTELEWTAASGGTALATFYEEGVPVSMGVLLSGVSGEADGELVTAVRQGSFEELLSSEGLERLESPERPLLVNVIFPGEPALIPRLQLLATALASVFFRVVIRMHAETRQAPQSPPE